MKPLPKSISPATCLTYVHPGLLSILLQDELCTMFCESSIGPDEYETLIEDVRGFTAKLSPSIIAEGYLLMGKNFSTRSIRREDQP